MGTVQESMTTDQPMTSRNRCSSATSAKIAAAIIANAFFYRDTPLRLGIPAMRVPGTAARLSAACKIAFALTALGRPSGPTADAMESAYSCTAFADSGKRTTFGGAAGGTASGSGSDTTGSSSSSSIGSTSTGAPVTTGIEAASGTWTRGVASGAGRAP